MRSRNNIWANVDWITIFIYLALVIMGWINIYSAVYNEDHASIFDISQRYGKQMIWIAVAILLAFMIILVDSKLITSISYIAYAVSILLLLAVLLFGAEVKGAKSWFQIGSFAFQPAEISKMTTAMALARYMSSYNYKVNIKSMSVIGLMILLPMSLILLQNDTGSMLVFGVFVFVLYREGLPGIYLFLGFLAAIVFIIALLYPPAITIAIISLGSLIAYGVLTSKWFTALKLAILYATIFATVWFGSSLLEMEITPTIATIITATLFTLTAILMAFKKHVSGVFWVILCYVMMLGLTFSVDYVFNNVLESHQKARIEELLGMKSDPLGVGYNVNQSKIAIGSGGFAGKGFLNGTQTKYDFVPEQSTDFIFCTVGEEWGFLGTSFVLLLFLALFLRLIFLSERQRSRYTRIYGYSVACILFFHVAINVGMTIGLAPVIGIPLPFFSYGGSSLLSFTVLLFLFVRLDASRNEKLSN